ncbi:hypothetical protein EO98_06290 [Methanosarcina sp. 2.H.T.1A.6]|uniref:hypothetical protein n=1 Tax=unclassified Methanosarcina TaxID=2644672 RepID=UPI0006222DF9|nr:MULTISPECIES: hypothetical protein [unclassified Methanosarcina]KKG14539.1 hypothetical protein EO94_14510 [Methanosarcina sp. 2.H.T.1A.3]KKG23296.1 hypothetical protein EO97_08610 [Methanosarcina sp. 2.H.T.1A.15]KKG24209.1 hypothetical protein EO96_00735 [Methanosarcina sp. 2.H.T.1A.8]KKG24978.1 hypothetical protein EO98_06290 [Methanosarcina sp. 2.H.T.1A.6]
MKLNKRVPLISSVFLFLILCSGCLDVKNSETQAEELDFTLVPDRTRVTEGEPFNIELVLTNTGNTNVNVWKLTEQISYDIIFVDSNGSSVPYECGVLERLPLTNEDLVELQPGESLKINQDSNCWTFPAGEYTLFAEYHTSGGEDITKPYWIGQISSNNVSIFAEAENKFSLSKSDASTRNRPLEESSVSDVPMTISVSSEAVYLSPYDLAKESNLILTGSVKEILPERWNTPDGKFPEKSFEDLDWEDVIYRVVVFSVDRYLKNSLPSEEVVVLVLGGMVGNLSPDVEDEPSFEPGEGVLLFLVEDTYPATKDLEPGHFVVCRVFQGKFSLTEDGKASSEGETIELE